MSIHQLHSLHSSGVAGTTRGDNNYYARRDECTPSYAARTVSSNEAQPR